MEGEEKCKEETMSGRLSLDDPRTNKSPFEKREMVIDTIASISRDDEEAMRVSMEATVQCYMSAYMSPNHEDPDIDRWLPRALRDLETIARRGNSISE